MFRYFFAMRIRHLSPQGENGSPGIKGATFQNKGKRKPSALVCLYKTFPCAAAIDLLIPTSYHRATITDPDGEFIKDVC